MEQKLLLGGSIIAIILLILMPSIPAIQHNTVEDGFTQELQKTITSINIDEKKDLLNGEKFPLLHYFVCIFVFILIMRANLLYFGSELIDDLITILEDTEYTIMKNFLGNLNEFINKRFGRAYDFIFIWAEFWSKINSIYGLGWSFPW